MAAQQQQRVDGWREPAGRREHSTAIVDNQLYLWGGYQDGMPLGHDSVERLPFYSSVEVFDMNTGCWEQRTTRGSPPLGVWGYSCVAVRNELHYFGGECGRRSCYHNSVHTLNTFTLQWRMLAPSTTEPDLGVPMQKHHCGMVHFADGEEDLLYVLGGEGRPVPSSPQHKAQYHQYGCSDVRTDEQHNFSLSKNEWISPVVTGQAPPPCYDFALTTVGGKRAAMFGGYTHHYSDDLYIVDLERHSVNWSKIKKPENYFAKIMFKWPERRYAHAASHITGGTVFVMIGGCGSGGSTLNEVWLCDTNQWNKLPTLLDSVTKRYYHSVSVFRLGANCIWVLVFGGQDYPNKAATSVIELIQDTSGQWCVERVMEKETLSNNTEYQERLREGRIKGVLGGRGNTIMKELMVVLDQESRQLQQQLQESEQSSQKRIREVEEENRVLNDRLQQLLEDKRKSKQDLEYCQRRIREVEEENRVLKDRPLLVQAGTQTDQDQLQHDEDDDDETEQEMQQVKQRDAAVAKAISQAPSNANLKVHVARKIPTRWHDVGTLLDIETSTLDALRTQITDPVQLFMTVFDQWKKEQKVPFTWETIISTLHTLGEKKTATELKKWLERKSLKPRLRSCNSASF